MLHKSKSFISKHLSYILPCPLFAPSYSPFRISENNIYFVLSKQKSFEQESPEQESSKQESSKQESSKQESSKQEKSKHEPFNQRRCIEQKH